MAIGTGGTNAATTLTALRHAGSFNNPNGIQWTVSVPSTQLPAGTASFAESDADIATINQAVKDDFLPATAPVSPYPPSLGGYSRQGQLYVPNRGWLKIFAGDVVMVDSQGWPILVSARSIQQGPWTTTAT
jgi:hypothetical protein